jgi:hypothetical protein
MEAGTPVRGFGAEAKLTRVLFSAPAPLGPAKRSQAVIAVRHRNLIAQIGASYQVSGAALTEQRVPPVIDVESGLAAATAEVLRRLGSRMPSTAASPPSVSASPSASAAPAPTLTVPPPGPGEVASVRDVCGRLAGDAASLIPGGRGYDISATDSKSSGSCYWETAAEFSPNLEVAVEAVPGSPLTGESGTALARALVTLGRDKRDIPGLGDEAIARHSSYDSERWGTSRTVFLIVRRANLIVYVRYDRWASPAKAAMDRDVVRLARKVLTAYPA